MCKSHTDPIQPIAPCLVLIILTQESHGVIAKRVGPGAPIGGFKQLLGCSYHEGLQTKDLCAREAVFLHVAFHA